MTQSTDKNKKKKPWYRMRNVVVTIIAVIVVLMTFAFWWYWTWFHAEPTISTDYRLQLTELAADAQPEGENGWPAIMDALRIDKEVDQAIQDMNFPEREEFWTDGMPEYTFLYENHEIRDDIERETTALRLLNERGCFDALDRARQADRYFYAWRGTGLLIDEDLSWLTDSRGLSMALRGDMRWAALNGDEARVVEDASRILLLGRAMSFQPTLICHHVGQAIVEQVYEEIRFLLQEHSFGESTLRRLLAGFDDGFDVAPLRVPFEGERLSSHDVVQHVFTDNGKGNGFLPGHGAIPIVDDMGYSDDQQSMLTTLLTAFRLADRAETIHMIDSINETFVRLAEQTSIERGKMEDHVQAIIDSLTDRHLFAHMTLPAYDIMIQQVSIHQTIRVGIRTFIAIELYRAQHERLPTSLDELVPAILSSAPIDPLTGKQLGYRMVQDDPFERSYLLYSFGLDREDNGGRMPTPDEYLSMGGHVGALRNEDAKGFDYVINQPRNYEEWFNRDVPP